MIKNQDSFDDTQSFRAQQEFDQQEFDQDGSDPFIDSELASIFDRYASALDSGDDAAAEKILSKYPEIGDEFRLPLRGLYLLGRAVRQQKLGPHQIDATGPTQLGDFEIQHELGRGGMGIVYAARQLSLKRRVALKVLPFTAVLDPRQVARFQNEAQAAASLHHPHIVPVYGVGCERGVHYYSMQLIEGQTLAEYVSQLKQSNFRPSKDAPQTNPVANPNAETADDLSTIATINSKNYVCRIMEMGARVAEAIHFAHENGIVHRDIKPSNLLLDQAGKIWVADFGLASGRGTSNLTSAGDRLGTLRYMSPEQAAGRNNQVDFRTDIYSLGITLCEILTLQPAFDGSDRIQVLAAIEASDPIGLRLHNSAIPVDVETVINKAIEKSPLDRYTSAQEFADDLLRCLDGKPIQAKRKTVLDRVCNSIAKHRWLVAGVVTALFATALTATIIASLFYNQRQREHVAAENARFYLQQAHNSVDRYGAILADELIEIPGTNELRAKLLGEAIGYYDDFLEFADRAPDLKFEQALAHSRLAGLYERIGNDAKALNLYEAAIGRHAALVESPESDFEKAVCFNKLGLLHKRRGEFSQSSKAINNSLASFDSLEPEFRKRKDVMSAEAQSRSNLGSLLWAKGNLEESAKQFEAALMILNIDGESNVDDAELRSTFFKINGNYVSVLQEVDIDRAESELRKSITSLEHANTVLRERDSDDGKRLSTKNNVTTTYEGLVDENAAHIADMQNNLAVVLSHQEQFKPAKSFANLAINYWKARIEKTPLEAYTAERLATAHNTLGEIQYRSNAVGLGEKSFKQAESMLARIVEQIPNRPETLSRLGGVLHNLSLVAAGNNQHQEARKAIELAIKYQSKAIEMVPENARYRHLLTSHRNVASAF